MNKRALAYERSKHFIGEVIEFRKKLVKIIGIYPCFVRVSNGRYTWCIDYYDLLMGGKK